MTADELRARQAPLKARYKDDPKTAQLVLTARGRLGTDSVTAMVETPLASPVTLAVLHPATGGPGDGSGACSGDMLLQALVGCAGVTMKAVATAMALPLRGGNVIAEGDIDFRGTLGVSKEVPVGFSAIRLSFELDTDASDQQLATLLKLTERYCVVYQTLRTSVPVTSTTTRR
jgi:uncharacterized OsmC-like protein